ncbi:uncharacterized protein BCR38DRAFT_406007 [Pseudomassariella vexata]|uniref:Uncharacterized protein n=1 Tax=Pseudomassariella vexata TaxID=1141098 RepID=A0A1Y2EHY6_9PEZI|nr:uncharacterized protein BCR38DRAFT_406007 [Pseudomassariella vexata]ORY70395.1 hypothetical protein BCR38DRAFT_406007 [Pseudomassariella vexata]
MLNEAQQWTPLVPYVILTGQSAEGLVVVPWSSQKHHIETSFPGFLMGGYTKSALLVLIAAIYRLGRRCSKAVRVPQQQQQRMDQAIPSSKLKSKTSKISRCEPPAPTGLTRKKTGAFQAFRDD